MRAFACLSLLLLGAALSACHTTRSMEAETAPAPAAQPVAEAPATPERPLSEGYVWTDARDLTIEGQGWPGETLLPWDRLPARGKEMIPETPWYLSRHSSGIAIRFVTDSPVVRAAWDAKGAMYHMPASGVSGLDVYTRSPEGEYRFEDIGRPKEMQWTEDTVATAPQGAGMQEYVLYLPLYSAPEMLMIGVEPDATLEPAPERPDSERIVFYGTSITQGGCASRAGMSHPAILARRLDREVVNFGFSGSGAMDMGMSDLIGELDSALIVLETMPNMTDEQVKERVVPFVTRLREFRPDTPILLVENCILPHESTRNTLLREQYQTLLENGVENLHYLPNHGMMNQSGHEEPTVDGIHPTDLGFVQLADAFESTLRALLGGGDDS